MSITYDGTGLACTSYGGPATNVIWRKSGQLLNIDGISYRQTQRIVYLDNATYETKLLFLDKSVENYKYTYECEVMNSRGNDFIRVTPQGEKIIVYYSNGILCLSLLL